MKKKLEADLMSIAHRVLQIKNKSDINQLCIETQKLYEKLSVLRFVEDHFGEAKPTIGQAEVVSKIEQLFEDNHLDEVKPVMSKLEAVAENVFENEAHSQKIGTDEIVPDEISASNEVVQIEFQPNEKEEVLELSEESTSKENEISFQPAFELDIEREDDIVTPKKAEAVQISFEDLLGRDYSDTLFVKIDKEKEVAEVPIDFELPKYNLMQQEDTAEIRTENIEDKTVTLNDKLSQGITIGLNDRIGFVKNLFDNSEEDYTRVLNQLITYDNFDQAKDFIVEMVKPDYEDWVGKEDYEQRFMEIVEKKFV